MLHSRTAKTTTSGQFRQCDRARRTVYIIRQSIIRHGLSARYRLEVHLLWTRAMSITTERRSMGGLRISQFFPAVRPRDSRCSLVFGCHSRAPGQFQRACLDTHFQTRYDNSPLSPNYRQPTSVARSRTTARTGFEKQRLSAFSRRGPSFWPLDRCQAQPDLLLIGDPRCYWRRRHC